jgi:Bor protein
VAILFLSFLSAGCARTVIHRTSAEPASGVTEASKVSQGTALWGFLQLAPAVNLSAQCPNGWQVVTTEVNAIQAVLRVVTLNLYAPWTVSVSCVAAPKPREEL